MDLIRPSSNVLFCSGCCYPTKYTLLPKPCARGRLCMYRYAEDHETCVNPFA